MVSNEPIEPTITRAPLLKPYSYHRFMENLECLSETSEEILQKLLKKFFRNKIQISDDIII